MKEVLQLLNKKISCLKYFNTMHDLAEKIEVDGKFLPAIFNSRGNYSPIDLDKKGSLCYWRLNGDISTPSQENATVIGLEYRKEVPLKFIGFIRNPENKDQYFTDLVANSIISVVTSNNSDLKMSAQAKRCSIVATKYVLNSRDVENGEYDTKIDKVRFEDCYFSIDFKLTIITNSQCYVSVCKDC